MSGIDDRASKIWRCLYSRSDEAVELAIAHLPKFAGANAAAARNQVNSWESPARLPAVGRPHSRLQKKAHNCESDLQCVRRILGCGL
jgi:hypothetical protein